MIEHRLIEQCSHHKDACQIESHTRLILCSWTGGDFIVRSRSDASRERRGHTLPRLSKRLICLNHVRYERLIYEHIFRQDDKGWLKLHGYRNVMNGGHCGELHTWSGFTRSISRKKTRSSFRVQWPIYRIKKTQAMLAEFWSVEPGVDSREYKFSGRSTGKRQ